MKISNSTRVSRENLPDAPAGEWLELLLGGINQSTEQFTQALQQNLTIADNTNSAIVKYDFTHSTERSIPNPLKIRPAGISVIRSAAINGGVRYRVQDIGWRFIDPPDAKSAQQIGVTISYAPPAGWVDVYRNATQSIANATVVPVQYDTEMTADYGSLSCDTATTSGTPATNSKIVCAVDGVVEITSSVVFDNAVSSDKASWLIKNNSDAVRWAQGYETTAGVFSRCHAAQISVTAGDYIQQMVYQSSGGAMNLLGGGLNAARLQARYIAPPSTAKNDVWLLVWGG